MNDVSADSLIQKSEESLQVQCVLEEQSLFNVKQFTVRSIQFNDCSIDQTIFILSISQSFMYTLFSLLNILLTLSMRKCTV